jgi:predicted  nucleic acid-binding Zn-ribbon protein
MDSWVIPVNHISFFGLLLFDIQMVLFHKPIHAIKFCFQEKNMGDSQFRKPLTQSAAILCGVVILFALISSPSPGASILAFFSGIGNLILLLIGLSIALPLSIAILVAIFLGAVALQSRKKASEMYLELKKNLPLISNPITEKWLCCNKDSNIRISQEEYTLMEQEITQLKETNVILKAKITELDTRSATLNKDLSEISTQNSTKFAEVTAQSNKDLAEFTAQNSNLKEQVDELSQAILRIQDSEKQSSGVITALNNKFDEIDDSKLRKQIELLELSTNETNTNIDDIAERLTTLEEDTEQAPTSGIFSYIKNEADRNALVTEIKKAISQEMTYAQIDEFLTKNLNLELNKIVKDHPSLTKNYIRNLKRD